ncbi:hypothetical protein CA54_37690 [Symmachiella macrocystis]|uniref:Outer membrane lipoprotein-sorting protein n=1 Tax=Symmachiella macrocystis TaxID=2527985 RepID=A0A5C6BW42_9PLAN|nr:hypothetical protein [Symmachiella macrocystis]TWU14899.1 hypothetical protein CA54_37690 [Symmachiella macrocystis]
MRLRGIVSYYAVFSMAAASLAAAEEPTAKPPAEKPAATSPELLDLLQKWEAASHQGEVVEIQFERYVYDHTFFTERRGIGRLVVQQPNQGLLELKPMPIQSEETSTGKDPNGLPYDLRPTSPMLWYWDGKHLNQIDTKEKSYKRIAIPETNPATSDELRTGFASWTDHLQINSKPHYLFHMVAHIKAEQLLKNYDWFRGKKNSNGFRLVARPKKEGLRQEFKQIDLLIDEESLQTYATRIEHTGGRAQTVSVIKDMKTDPAQIGDWRPKLSGYKLVGNPGTE